MSLAIIAGYPSSTDGWQRRVHRGRANRVELRWRERTAAQTADPAGLYVCAKRSSIGSLARCGLKRSGGEKKAVGGIKKEIKDATCRKNLALPKEVIIARLNQALRGWANYFYYGNCSKTLAHLRNYTEERVRVYLSRKHRFKGRGYTKYPNTYLYENLGLYKIPATAPWAQAAKAAGRR